MYAFSFFTISYTSQQILNNLQHFLKKHPHSSTALDMMKDLFITYLLLVNLNVFFHNEKARTLIL